MRISHYIRVQNLLHLILPTIILIAILIAWNKGAVNMFSPAVVDDIATVSEEYTASHPFAVVNLNDLTYTGFNQMKGDKIVGGYYFFFADDTCYFVVLKPTSDDIFPQHIDKITPHVRLQYNPHYKDSLVSSLSTSLDWSASELEKLTSPIVCNEVSYYPVLNGLLLVLSSVLLCVVAANIIVLLSGLVFPSLALATMRQNNYFILPKELKAAEKELSDCLIYKGENMYVTEKFFINLSYSHVCVVPLEQVVWAYYHSVLHRNSPFRHTITYSLRLVTEKRRIISLSHKTKAACSEVLDAISTLYPEVMIGYSGENQLNFMYHIRHFFDKKSNDDDV